MHPSLTNDNVPIPDELKYAPETVLEGYVSSRVKQFSRVFASVLVPGVSDSSVETAFTKAIHLLGSAPQRATEALQVRFRHNCRYFGCTRKECVLCVNNPYKRCSASDNFDDCYADNQALKSRCEADVFLDVVRVGSSNPVHQSGIELQLSIIDGESYNQEGTPSNPYFKELLRSDEGHFLLGTHNNTFRVGSDGRLLLKLQDGVVKLPDVCILDKNDTFHMDGNTYAAFRMMAKAVTRDHFGNVTPLESIAPAVSQKFIVKTQRALNDYRKSEYPHYKDELTKLKFIGNITAQRFKEIGQHLGPDLPCTTVETVEQLCELMEYADTNRQIENKMVDLLNMKGKHKHKWEYLKEVLYERVVYDDMMHRIWFADEAMTRGVLFSAKQGQVNMDKPLGLIKRVSPYGPGRFQVLTNMDGSQQELLKTWRQYAEAAWNTPNHSGWTLVQDTSDIVCATGPLNFQDRGMMGVSSPSFSHAMSPISTSDGVPEPSLSMVTRSPSGIISPMSQPDTHCGPSYPSSTFMPAQRLPTDIPDATMDLRCSPVPGSYSSGRAGPMQGVNDLTAVTSHHDANIAHSPCASTPIAPIPRGSLNPFFSVPNPFNGSSSFVHGASASPPQPLTWSRVRRMSADAAPYRSLKVAVPNSPNAQDLQAQNGKRLRNPGGMGTVTGAEQQLLNQPRQLPLAVPAAARPLNHSESNGRYAPRHRTSTLDLTLVETNSAFGDQLLPDDLDRILSGMPMSPGAVVLTPRDSMSQVQESFFAPDWLENAAGMAAGTMFGMRDNGPSNNGDSLKGVHRALKRSESDSFKRLLEPILFPENNNDAIW